MSMNELREDVYETLLKLPENDLVMGTMGNASGRKDDRVIIKPSGIAYDDLSPSNLVVVDMDGEVVEGELKPSVDTEAHLHIYRQTEGVGGIVHTHSTYATAFAALDREIPVYLTELADLFGDPIPVSDYVRPGSEDIGVEFAEKTDPGRYRGLLMKNHGLFTAGDTLEDALKATLHIEHGAEISYLAEDIGDPVEIPGHEVEWRHQEYLEGYGQG